ncbi:glycosyltransferase family 2 protein [Chryseobacterium sp. KMC2]|uniref:glycosyltransferase family 2 protein n=1 Tax=Chryseobacterium sp. KMC2 TaxID=2800705 RepID=UPI0019241107|nr:glycosyltransferase family 2 protein [Chryseobacterium sp. KMC2]MBL3547349.1 glycosyltransferase family 2 protein [Chryseobacterium sp. KMC2]
MDTSILLATYNSSYFLRAQLNSLYEQTDLNWELIVRDDGSTDNTIEIIREYQQKYNNIKILEDNEKGLGAMNSFMRLLEKTKSEYYFFCDHDDVWLPHKIEVSKNAMYKAEEKNKNIPIIIHTDLIVVDGNLKVINDSFWKSSGIKPNILDNKNFIQVFNFVTGCSMMFNNTAKQVSFPYPKRTPMHDWWIAIQTLKNNGKVIHLENPSILYRQHGGNEVGARKVDLNYFVKKVKNINATLKGHQEHIEFLKEAKGLNVFQYYFYKILYTIIRKI